MDHLGKKSYRKKNFQHPIELQQRIVQMYTMQMLSAPRIHAILLQEQVDVRYNEILMIIKNAKVLRSRGDATRYQQYSEMRVCKHCNESFSIMNNAQVYCKRCCPTRPSYQRLQHYGLSQPEFDSLLQMQNGLCKICNCSLTENPRKLDVDHNHKTGKIRGLLCHRCNMIVGFLDKGDWTAQLQKISSYIEDGNQA